MRMIPATLITAGSASVALAQSTCQRKLDALDLDFAEHSHVWPGLKHRRDEAQRLCRDDLRNPTAGAKRPERTKGAARSGQER